MKLKVNETDLKQGSEEEIAYSLTTTPWGSNPSDVLVKAYDMSNALTDVSDTVLEGDPSVSDDVITTPVVKSLTEGKKYRIEIKFTSGGNVFETFFELEARR